jgi:hypothetical protein
MRCSCGIEDRGSPEQAASAIDSTAARLVKG